MAVGHDERRALVISGLLGLGIGSLAYDLVVRLLTHLDVAVPLAQASHVDTRDLVLRLVPVVALAAAFLVARGVPGAPASPIWVVSGLLMAAGWVWVAWGLLDQHVLHLFEIAPGSSHPLWWDLLFHGGGAAVGAVGWNLLDAHRHRPSPWDELARKRR